MSRKHKETVTCPKCGHTQDFIVWESLNGDLNPEAKQQLLDGVLFRLKCEQCGSVHNVNYGVLYHDMAHQAMVYYVNESSVEITKEMMLSAAEVIGADMSGYRRRIVTDQNTLREKAIIFNHGLDDCLVEVIKLIYYANVCEQFPDTNIDAVYFRVADDKYILEFLGDEMLSADIPVSVYEKLENDIADRLTTVDNNETIIDMDWALSFLKN